MIVSNGIILSLFDQNCMFQSVYRHKHCLYNYKNINLRICFSLMYYPQEVSIAAQHDKVYRLPYYQNVDKVVLVSYFEYDKSYLASRQLSPLGPLVEHQNIHPRKGNQLISECPLVLLLSMDIN